ncbi:MAG: T9SS type A sorting domain-containing protein [bacterium]|nr:T9SS type A sorting domain-containing protein [bacterium]
MSPSATNDGDQVFVFWVEENSNQSQYGLYAQKFSPTGDRLWTDSGLELLPLGDTQIWSLKALAVNDGIYAGYLIGSTNTAARVIRTDYSGLVEWGPTTISATSLGGKGDLKLCVGNSISAFLAWEDSRNESGIYAQNIDPNGDLGPYMGINNESSFEGATSITVFPNPVSASLNIDFSIASAGNVSVEIFDVTGRLIKTLLSEERAQGTQTAVWDRRNSSGQISAPGIYFIKLRHGAESATSKVILL